MYEFASSQTTDIVGSSLALVWAKIIGALPQLVAALVVLLVGWFIAAILARAAWHVVRLIRLDAALARVGFKDAWERSGFHLDSPRFFSEIIKWFFVIVFLMAATNIVGLTQVSSFLSLVVLYIPKVIVAALILLIGILVAKFLEGTVRASVRAAGLASANFLGTLTKWAVFIFSFLIALSQLEVAGEIVRIFLVGFVAALSLALGLSFGLGGVKHADELIARLRRRIED